MAKRDKFGADPHLMFQTPEVVADYMASLLPSKGLHVLEPTPGQGNLVRALSRGKHLITAPIDFFCLNPEWTFDAVVMNPPFSAKYTRLENAPEGFKGLKVGYHILFECMKKSDLVIALVPWFLIADSDVRLKHVMSYGLRKIISLPRSTFKYVRIQTCIIVLQKGYQGKTEFDFFQKEVSNG